MYSVRVKFKRGEAVKFISHLDLMKVFERAIRRSGLPIAYSHGFNPHPDMVFGLPLPVGVTSGGEYADFGLIKEIKPAQFMDMLNGSLPEATRIIAADEKKTKKNIMASISAADYTLDVFTDERLTLDRASEKINNMMSKGSIIVLKEGKNTSREIDIRPLILDVGIKDMEAAPAGYRDYISAFTVNTRFRAGSKANLRPELFIKAIAEYAGIPVAASRLHRAGLYVESDGKFIDPLDKVVLNT